MTAQPSASTPGPGPGVVLAPAAPGRLGTPAPVDALRDYLRELGEWRDGRRRELDRLDEAAQAATDPDSNTGDVTLSMALWQAVSDRYEALLQAWDSGRADVLTRERMSQLIWGRLDAAPVGGPGSGPGDGPGDGPAGALGGLGALGALGAGFGVSLVDACRLSDALAAQLRARLSFDPRAAHSAQRVTALRAAMERLRALAEQEPGSVGIVQRLVARVEDLAGAAARGGDVTGPLGLLEADAARAERDLIVTTATRQQRARDRGQDAADLVRDRVRAMNELAALEHRQGTLEALAERCAREVALAPRLAVPEPEALGPVPTDRAGVDAFLARLGDVARAMDQLESAYAAPLAERDELGGRFDAYRVMAARTGRDADREVMLAGQLARAALQARPCDLDSARSLVVRYSYLVRPSSPPASGATR